jgi:hypothetical protein
LKFVVYVSHAVKPFTEAELVTLLERTRLRNQRAGITGMLLYKDGNFMQVLEGEASVVDATLTRIERDPRHTGLVVIEEGSHKEREFGDWSMAYRNLNDTAVHAMPGYSQFMNLHFDPGELAGSASVCRELLQLFRDSMQ